MKNIKLSEPIRWRNNNLEMLDQRLLPAKKLFCVCKSDRDVYNGIEQMVVRGAPAIGIAGAYGVYLGIRKSKAADFKSFEKNLKKVIKYISKSRPTARNLFWAMERMHSVALKNKNKPVSEIKTILLDEAHLVHKEDMEICKQIGDYGRSLIRKKVNVLTHCNAGGLATGGYGTALGVIFSSKKNIKRVYADETRPVLQGARLTVWELLQNKIPTTLICDNMAASMMGKGRIDLIVVGADRIAANGDTANKIGTYNLAVLAKYHNIPFYIAAPFSTFDLSLKSGDSIPIEERSSEEVKRIGSKLITEKKVEVANPSFDVTPAKLITAIITEKGVIKKPDKTKILKTFTGK